MFTTDDGITFDKSHGGTCLRSSRQSDKDKFMSIYPNVNNTFFIKVGDIRKTFDIAWIAPVYKDIYLTNKT